MAGLTASIGAMEEHGPAGSGDGNRILSILEPLRESLFFSGTFSSSTSLQRDADAERASLVPNVREPSTMPRILLYASDSSTTRGKPCGSNLRRVIV